MQPVANAINAIMQTSTTSELLAMINAALAKLQGSTH